MATPKKNVAYEFSMPMVDTLNPTDFKVNPTIAEGDFQVSTNNGAFADLTALPVVQPAGSILVKVTLSAAEMNGDKVAIRAKDVVGGEWDEALVFIDVPIVTQDDLEIRLILASKFSQNKLITNPNDGTLTLFDDNGTTVLLTGILYEDVAGTRLYRGQGADRRDRLI